MEWGEIARAQDGAINHRQLGAAGVSPSAAHRLVRAGALEPQERGVYLARGAPHTYRARLWIAVLCTGGVLGFGTAGHLWGAVEDPPPLIDVVLPPTRRVHRPHGVRVHRVCTPPSRITAREGLQVTTRAQSLLDHLGRLASHDAQRLADRALQRGWLTLAEIERHLREYPGRQGNARLREIAAACGDGAAAHSERVLHRLLRQAGVTRWRPNHSVWFDGELVAVVDVAIPDRRLAIEVDGRAFHTDVDRFQRDRQRQNALVALGWTVLRFTWADLTERPGYVLATIQQHLG